MKKKDIAELKKRFKKDKCTFTKLCGCYVNSQKNIILHIKETFLNLDDEEFFKYLEIAKKVLSGTIGNNLLQLDFPLEGEDIDSTRQSLIALKKSALKDDNLLENFYKSVIDNYDYEGNFLILVFHDAYDVMKKTTDNSNLDESEEVYEYILCAVCPVELSKPGLGYLQDENRIGSLMRDWVVSKPDIGFVFPAFTDRSSNFDSVIYYTKNPKDPHEEFMEGALSCPSKQTAALQKETFHSLICSAAGGTEDKETNKMLMEIQENINSAVEENDDVTEENPEILTSDKFSNILSDSGVSEDLSEKIQKSFEEKFSDELPLAENLIDKKAVKENIKKKKEHELNKKVQVLKEELQKTKQTIEDENSTDDISDYDVVLSVKPEKVPDIKSDVIDGRKCIVIPLEDDEHIKLNGVMLDKLN
ncbi:DUF4317 domain-containing protein [Clostridium sp. BJN0001]|uniref:DUF4317 domain-containing protein n=1 Tax=Clostridium sp. BJN0001 TaxID=2930219 RepID=UPI001FD2157D|nr:DUF4317 domain-containing protein [Clostridium sp. BJN0001]